MKKTIFIILFAGVLLGCESEKDNVFFKSNVCFESVETLNQFAEFNDFSSEEVSVKKVGSCLEIYTKNKTKLTEIQQVVNYSHPQVNFEVKTYRNSNNSESTEKEFLKLPSVSFPSIFDVFNRLLPQVNNSN